MLTYTGGDIWTTVAPDEWREFADEKTNDNDKGK